MAKKFLQKLSTTADLDTSAPVSSDLAPGTLVEAKDLSSQFWGPRKGSLAFTRAWEGPGTASLYDAINFTGLGTYARGRSFEDQFRDLGTSWTLDLYFRLEETAYSGAETIIGLYQYSAGSGNIAVWIRGAGHANPGRVAVEVITTPTRTTADTTLTLSGTTTIATGTDQNDKTHVRVVREGLTVTLYVNGVSDVSGTLSANSPIFGSLGTGGVVKIASSVLSPTTEATFKGNIYAAVLRDGAYDTLPIENTIPHAPWSRNIHHFILGREVTYTGGADHIFDAGRFGVHLTFVGGSSNYTTTAANNNRHPSPCTVQGMRTWTTRTNRTATSVMVGGGLSTKIIA